MTSWSMRHRTSLSLVQAIPLSPSLVPSNSPFPPCLVPAISLFKLPSHCPFHFPEYQPFPFPIPRYQAVSLFTYQAISLFTYQAISLSQVPKPFPPRPSLTTTRAVPRIRPARPRPDPGPEAQELLHAHRRHDRRDVPDRVVSIVQGMTNYVENGLRRAHPRSKHVTLRRFPGFGTMSRGSSGRMQRRPRVYYADAAFVRTLLAGVFDTPWRAENLYASTQYVRPKQVDAHAVDGDYSRSRITP